MIKKLCDPVTIVDGTGSAKVVFSLPELRKEINSIPFNSDYGLLTFCITYIDAQDPTDFSKMKFTLIDYTEIDGSNITVNVSDATQTKLEMLAYATQLAGGEPSYFEPFSVIVQDFSDIASTLTVDTEYDFATVSKFFSHFVSGWAGQAWAEPLLYADFASAFVTLYSVNISNSDGSELPFKGTVVSGCTTRNALTALTMTGVSKVAGSVNLGDGLSRGTDFFNLEVTANVIDISNLG